MDPTLYNCLLLAAGGGCASLGMFAGMFFCDWLDKRRHRKRMKGLRVDDDH